MINRENLVFLPDSPYSNWIIERSEKIQIGLNKYVSIVDDPSKTNFINNALCTIVKYNSQQFEDEIGDLGMFKRVIVHFHTPFTAHFLWKNRSKIRDKHVTWVLWSGDLYKLPQFLPKAYSDKTKQAVGSIQDNLSFKNKIHHSLLWLGGKPNYFTHIRSFRLFDDIATPFEKDYLNACTWLNISPRRVKFGFLSIEEIFGPEIFNSRPNPGTFIMVGHSGSLENNHLDVFDTLAGLLGDKEKMVFSPLSYGNPDYIQRVIESGTSKFRDNFLPQVDFIPREQYYRRLREVGFAIFNHKIQQAFGNILALIFLGVKVYLNEENPVFFQLKNWGIIVKDYKTITLEDLGTPLNDQEIVLNRAIIRRLFSEEKINGYYAQLLLSE